MKLKTKNILKAILICLMVCFSTLFIVFSINLTNNNIIFSEKTINRVYSSRNDNIILQTAVEENKWASKLKEDVNNLNYQETEELGKLVKHSFSTNNNPQTYTGNISSGYHKGSHEYGDDHTITFEFKLKVNGRYVSTGTFDQWIDDNSSHGTKWFTLSGMSQVNLKPTDNISIDLTRAYVKGNHGWSAGLSISNVVSQSEFDVIVKNKLSGNANYFNINSVQLQVTYDGSNESGYNDMKVEVRSITQTKFGITENTTREDNSEKTLKIKKVFMSDDDINNGNFSDAQLKDLLDLYIDNRTINKSNLEYEYINLDKTNKQINLKLKKINVSGSQDYYETPREYHITIHVVNFNYFIEGSILSSSYWDHKSNGEVQYHTNKPQTKLRLSERFLETLYIATSKKELLEKIEKDNWGFVGNDKNLAIGKINDFSLNASNYEDVKRNYYNSHDIAVIDRLTFDHSFDKYLTQFNNSQLEDYLYIFKNMNGSFKFGIESYEDKSFDLDSLLNGIKVEISDVEARALDSNRTNWSMRIKDLKIVNQNKNWLINNKWLFDLPNDNFKNYDLSLEYGSSSRELIHKYLYQAHGIDVSKNISFVMEDGTMLDQDFKVTKASSESNLNLGDQAYVAIRYWTKFGSGQEEYVTIIKKNNSWYSEKYQKDIIDLDSSFNESKIEYLFNQDLQMIINPYQNSSGASITSATPQSFGIKRVTDVVEGRVKVLEDWNDGLWSHSHNSQGHATFDGIFGADINGIFDSRGRLTQGKHHINVELQNSTNSQMKNNFYINIDKNPVQVEVNGIDSSVEKSILLMIAMKRKHYISPSL